MARSTEFLPRLEGLEVILCLDAAPMPASPIPVLPSPIPTQPFEPGGPLDELIFGPSKWVPTEPYGTVPQQGPTPPCLANSCPGDDGSMDTADYTPMYPPPQVA